MGLGEFIDILRIEFNLKRRPLVETSIDDIESTSQRGKEIWGVMHDTPEELEQVKSALSCYYGSVVSRSGRVGLEITPETARYRRFDFFYEGLLKHLHEHGKTPVALEHPDYFFTSGVLQRMYDIRCGRASPADPISLDRPLSRGRAPTPSVLYQDRERCSEEEAVHRLLKIGITLPEVEHWWDTIDNYREVHELRTIKSDNLDLVIIGDKHARRIASSLPDYTYVTFNPGVIV